MAEPGNLATAFSAMLTYEMFRRSIMLAMFNRDYERDFASAYKITVPNVSDDNITIDTPADGTALETAPQFETAALGENTYSRALIRGTSQQNLMQAIESRAGAGFTQNLMERLNTRLAIKLDDQLLDVLTNVTYGNAAGNGFLLDTVGASGANGWGIKATFPHRLQKKGSSTATEADLYNGVIGSIEDAELKWRLLEVMGGQSIGHGAPSGFCFVTSPPIARQLVIWAKSAGVLDLETSAARQAATTSGILGNMAYHGRIANIDIASTNSSEVAIPTTDGSKAPGYFLPTGSAVTAAVRPTLWDFAQYGSGNTGGAFVRRTTVILPYVVGVLKPDQLGKTEILVRTG